MADIIGTRINVRWTADWTEEKILVAARRTCYNRADGHPYDQLLLVANRISKAGKAYVKTMWVAATTISERQV